jgi:hypothetical protein
MEGARFERRKADAMEDLGMTLHGAIHKRQNTEHRTQNKRTARRCLGTVRTRTSASTEQMYNEKVFFFLRLYMSL